MNYIIAAIIGCRKHCARSFTQFRYTSCCSRSRSRSWSWSNSKTHTKRIAHPRQCRLYIGSTAIQQEAQQNRFFSSSLPVHQITKLAAATNTLIFSNFSWNLSFEKSDDDEAEAAKAAAEKEEDWSFNSKILQKILLSFFIHLSIWCCCCCYFLLRYFTTSRSNFRAQSNDNSFLWVKTILPS